MLQIIFIVDQIRIYMYFFWRIFYFPSIATSRRETGTVVIRIQSIISVGWLDDAGVSATSRDAVAESPTACRATSTVWRVCTAARRGGFGDRSGVRQVRMSSTDDVR